MTDRGTRDLGFWPVFARLLVRPSTSGCSSEDEHPSSEAIRHEGGPIPEPDGGHGRLLPWGSVPFGGISADDRSTALPRLYRPPSRFLTVSAVFSHPSLVALFHATSALRISVFRAFPSSPAVIPLGTRCSPVVTPAFGSDRLPGHSGSPLPSITRLAHFQWGAAPGSCCAPPGCARHQPHRITQLSLSARRRRAARAIQRLMRGFHPVRPSPSMGKLQRLRVSQGVDFRASIRRRVRSRCPGFTP